jgi:hypothetical protein
MAAAIAADVSVCFMFSMAMSVILSFESDDFSEAGCYQTSPHRARGFTLASGAPNVIG